MGKTRQRTTENPATGGGFSETRVDGAHVLRTEGASGAAAPGTPHPTDEATSLLPAVETEAAQATAAINLAVVEADLREPVELHARQLGEHLAARQRAIDEREAQLNAQHAELDNGWRSVRLWFQERQHELAEQEAATRERLAQLDERAEQLEQRERELAATQEAFDSAERRAGLDERLRGQELVRRERELADETARLERQAALQRDAQTALDRLRHATEEETRRRQQQVQQQRTASLETFRQALAGLEHRRQALEAEAARVERLRHEPGPEQILRTQELADWQSRLQSREARLDDEERQAERHLAELLAAREQFDRDREDHAEQLRHERQQLIAAQRRAARDVEQQRQRQAVDAAELDGRRETLEQLRSDLSQVHRESLEMRLATEELWAQLSLSVAPGLLNQSIGRIRARLADRHRLALSELADRCAELERLRSELTELQTELAARRDEFQAHAATRQAELERQAERLAARQNELATAEAEQLRAAHDWERERLGYQRELRRLAAALRREEDAAAA